MLHFRSIMKYIPWLTSVLLIIAIPFNSLAQDDIPQTSGLSGYLLFGPGFFNIESNLLVTGPPLVQDAGSKQIESVFNAPESQTAFAFPLAGEINYTFSKSRTQIFFGNRLEDILRLDVPFGLGIRQELPDSSILALSMLITPSELKYWEDPYVEGVDRERTKLKFRGARLRWGRILKTGLELTATARWYQHGVEKSGEWLIDQGRLDPQSQQLLNRDGRVLRLQALYRIDLNRQHRFEPAIRYIDDKHDGAAMANTGFSTQLTYLYRSKKVVLDANVAYGKRTSKVVHPVYNETLEAKRIGASITAFIPIKLFKSRRWMIWVSTEFYTENSNIDFFDSSFTSVMGGLGWRHNRK